MRTMLDSISNNLYSKNKDIRFKAINLLVLLDKEGIIPLIKTISFYIMCLFDIESPQVLILI